MTSEATSWSVLMLVQEILCLDFFFWCVFCWPASLCNLGNKAKPTWRTIFFSVFISFMYMFRATVPIIRKNNCIYVTLGICHSVWLTVWYAGCTLHIIQSDKYQVSHTVISPDDGHIVARNMYRKEINTRKKLFTKLALFTSFWFVSRRMATHLYSRQKDRCTRIL